MATAIKDRTKLLKRLAESKAISWEQDAKLLPKDDDIALIGLLADRLGIPLSTALDPDSTDEQLRDVSEAGIV